MPITATVGIYGTTVQSTRAVAYAGVAITNRGNTCDLLQRHVDPANTVALVIEVGRGGATATEAGAISPGTYSVAGSSDVQVVVAYSASDAQCLARTSAQASMGTVTLTQADSGTVAGSFDVTFPSGDRIAGTFSAPVCNADISSPATTCGS